MASPSLPQSDGGSRPDLDPRWALGFLFIVVLAQVFALVVANRRLDALQLELRDVRAQIRWQPSPARPPDVTPQFDDMQRQLHQLRIDVGGVQSRVGSEGFQSASLLNLQGRVAELEYQVSRLSRGAR